MERYHLDDGHDVWHWTDREDEVAVHFTGRGFTTDLADAVRTLVPAGVEPAWAKQVHSARVLEARPGPAGEADALIRRGTGLALTVVTADCVPVLIAGRRTRDGREIAAVHAGWRGIAGRIVPETLERLAPEPAQVVAWIGPAIGRCCYEVGEDVAAQVLSTLGDFREDDVVAAGPRGRPHLDLRAVVEKQLRTEGVGRIRHAEHCTRCTEGLWSYRRDGKKAGRNLAVICALS